MVGTVLDNSVRIVDNGEKINFWTDNWLGAPLLSCVPSPCSSQGSYIFVAAIVHTLHAIWMACSHLRFTNDKVTTHATKVEISSAALCMVTFLQVIVCLRIPGLWIHSQYLCTTVTSKILLWLFGSHLRCLG